MSVTLFLSALAFGLLIRLFLWSLKRNRHWKEMGIKHEKPFPFVGSALPLVTGSMSKGDLYTKLYFKYKGEPFVGMHEFTRPQLLIRDPEIIGNILVKDFGHFVDHGFYLDEETNWIDMNLFSLRGSRWRAMRMKILPTFTSGKLKGMHWQMVESADDLISRLSASNGADVDTKDEISRYTTEVIASAAFGLDATRSDSKFREMGNKALQFNFMRYLGVLVGFSIPWLSKWFKVSMTRPDVGAYYAQIIKDTFDYRRKNNVSRNDFVQLLLQLKDKGSVEIQSRDPDDDYLMLDATPVTETIELTEKMLVAQAFTFIVAGFESMSSSINFALLELAKNPIIQEKLRKEVIECHAKHGNKFTYQCLKEMTYLDMFINETLRLYPLVGFLIREVTKDYYLEGAERGKKFKLETGTMVVIPVGGIQLDPNYWPDPERFQPERWSTENQRTPFTYLPFGDGPRMCIGMRFALLQIKQTLSTIVKEFKVEMSPKTKLPLEMRKSTLILVAKDPIYLRFKKLK